MEQIIADLLDMFPDTVSYALNTTDGWGDDQSTSGAGSIRAFIQGSSRQVRLGSGQIVRSTMQATLAGAPGITVDHNILLPSRFPIRSPKIVAVEQVNDENGAHHEVVYF